MSEPVIKAFMVTMERGEDGKAFWREHFTRDDLVRAVAATLDYYSGVSKEDVQAEASTIVDRLTKGET